MKISIVAQYNPNMFPTLHYLAVTLEKRGHEVQFFSIKEPTNTGAASGSITWVPIRGVKGIRSRIPILRSAHLRMLGSLIQFRPDVIVGEHEFLIPGFLYRQIPGLKRVKLAGYFCDYYSDTAGMARVKRWANLLSAYVDVCDLRLAWRQEDWPHMSARTFVVRHAPLRRPDPPLEPHAGPPRVIYTGSRNALGMDKGRLARFLERLCGHGIAVDWYLVATSAMTSSDEVRAEARALTSHPLYSVRDPVPKSELAGLLRTYDAGLLWAPLAEGGPGDDFWSRYLLSAASNKLGEYISAGLIAAYTGNPGLSYLPDAVCAVFDPTYPEAGADQLAAAIYDRATVERKRAAALRYHLDEMNFEAQLAPLIRYLVGEERGAN